MQVSGTNYPTSGISQQRFENNNSGATLALGHSRNGTQGSHTILQVNDEYGKIRFYGSDGTDFDGYGAAIVAKVETGIAHNSTPGRLEFHTTASSSNNATERLRITSGGTVNIGGDYANTTGKLKVTGVVTVDGGFNLTAGTLTAPGGFSISSGNVIISGDIAHDADSDTTFGFGAGNDTFRVKTAGTERISVSGGYVGINVTNPQAFLDIGGNADGDVKASFTRANDPNFRIQVRNESSSNNVGASQGKFGLFYASNSADICGMQFHRGSSTGAGSLSFTTGGTERLSIDSDGDLTLQQSATLMSPGATLNIISDKNVETGLDNKENYHLVLANPNNDTGEAIGLAFGITDTTTKVGAAIVHERDAAGSQGSLKFFTRPNNAGPPTEKVRITSSGEVGINVTNPETYGLSGTGYGGLTVQAPSGGYSGITIRSNYAGGGALLFADGNGSDAERKNLGFAADHVNKRMNFLVEGSTVCRFTANGFHPNPADSAATTALDDYEEGSWTPSFYPLSSNIPVTYTTREGKYTKIGNVVYWHLKIQVSNITGNRNQSFGISGFPHNITNSQDQASGNFYGETWDGEIPTTLKYFGNVNRGQLYYYADAMKYYSSSMLDINVSSSMLIGSGFYYTS